MEDNIWWHFQDWKSKYYSKKSLAPFCLLRDDLQIFEKNFRRHKYKIQHDTKYSAWNMKGQVAKNQVHLHALHCTLSWPIATQLCGQAISFFKDHEMPNLPILQEITIFWSWYFMLSIYSDLIMKKMPARSLLKLWIELTHK